MLGKMGLLTVEKGVSDLSVSNGGGELDATWVNIDSDEGESDGASSDWSSPGSTPLASPRTKPADGTRSGEIPIAEEKARKGGYAAAVEAKMAPSTPEAEPGVLKAPPAVTAAPPATAEPKAAEPGTASPKCAPASVPKPAAPRPRFNLEKDYFRAELDSVQELAKDRTFKVTLKTIDANSKRLQMFIGDGEGKALAQACNGWKWQQQGCKRPLTYDFMKNVCEALERKVAYVRVCASERGVFYARAHFDAADGTDDDASAVGVDSRPSDALNLAMRFGAPIYVHRQLVPDYSS